MKPVETKTAERRVKRVPVGGPRDILTVLDKDPNYVYRFVLEDIPGRVERFKLGGYEVVTDDLEIGQRTVDRASKLGSAVTAHAGGGRKYVLMRIPREWYDEDQKAKQDKVDQLEATMMADVKRGVIPGTGGVPGYGNLDIARKR